MVLDCKLDADPATARELLTIAIAHVGRKPGSETASPHRRSPTTLSDRRMKKKAPTEAPVEPIRF